MEAACIVHSQCRVAKGTNSPFAHMERTHNERRRYHCAQPSQVVEWAYSSKQIEDPKMCEGPNIRENRSEDDLR